MIVATSDRPLYHRAGLHTPVLFNTSQSQMQCRAEIRTPLLKWKKRAPPKMKFFPVCISLLVLYSTQQAGSAELPEKTCDLKNVDIVGGEYTLNKDGSKLQFKCPEGKYPYPVSSRKCTHLGKWSTMRSPSGKAVAKALCKDVTCPTPVQFEHGSYHPRQQYFYNGSVLTFECYEGYILQGSVNRTCLPNGKWSGQTTICDDGSGHCKNPGTPIGAIKFGTQYRIEDKVNYQCQNRLVMFGSSERECLESKEWSGTEPTCRAWYTYDTPEEVSASFISSLAAAIEVADPDKVDNIFSPRKIKIEKGGKLDIYILLDASLSVGQDDFKKGKDSVIKLIEKVSSYDISPRYGVITFATEPKIIMNIQNNNSTDASEVIDRLEKFSYKEHADKAGTNIRDAMQEVYNMMILQQLMQKDTFMKIRHVLVLMTDGKSNMGGDPKVVVRNIRDLLNIRKTREDFLDIYVFGLGDIDDEEINALASKKDNEHHVFKLKDIADLQKTFEDIIDDTDAMDMCGMGKESNDPEDALIKNPWLTTITISRTDGEEACKGALVSEYFIITAAHCFNVDDEAHLISVKIGRSLNKVEKVIFHPNYNINAKKAEGINEFYDYDIALVKVKSKVKFNPEARPICIPCTEGTTRALRKVHPDTTCKDHEDELLNVNVGIVPAIFIAQKRKHEDLERKNVKIKTGDKKHACNRDALEASIYKNVVKNVKDVVTERFLCTGGIDPVVDDNTCKGESGGPLIITKKKRYIQVAVISWGVYDLCKGGERHGQSPPFARDFHLNLFQVLPFLREHLKEELKFLP
ncbi:complement factor B isoform X1 [Microcaecilia unicolor]|uniref:Complement factor B n=2 Tax=Microcaecilia unicolor TaxID=1415580 RepID=A0A6P7XIZ9_9AMPH|nr:complement factor B isoform X1 [Microcaecilia unicolor]